MNSDGNAGRFFEDVSVGDALTPLPKRIDPARMMAYGAAAWDFIRAHYDAEYARHLGFPGPGVFPRKLAFRNRVMAYPGDSLLQQLQATVGRELVFQAPDEIGRSAFRQYALAVGDFNPLYSDREQAAAYGLRDVMAPPALVCDTWQYVDSDMDERGDLLGRGAFGELTGLRAGNEYEFFQPVHPDDTLTAHWQVKDVYQRTGRSGVVIFQVIEATYHNQRGELLARNTETLFYREDPSP